MPSAPSYAELHAHSGYSFLDGASPPEELVLEARRLGYPALALTDHNGIYGSMEFARAAKEAGLRPITGAEVTLRACFPGDAEREAGWEIEDPWSAGARRTPEEDPLRVGHHLTLLADNGAGYANLCSLLTEAHFRSPRRKPALPFASLAGRTEGLVCLTGCRRGPLLRALEGSAAEGEAFARRLCALFGPGRLFVELQDNGVRGDAARAKKLARLADRLRVPVVATGNAHYHRRERHRLQDVLVSIRNRATLDASHEARRANANFHLASPGEMARRFEGRPDAIRNTLEIAERCAAFDLSAGTGYEFPDFEGSERGSAMRVLAGASGALLDERYPPGSKHRPEAVRRLEEELRLVERHRLAGFFLVYRDILDLAREVAARVRESAPRARSNLPPGRGRGSSVSSILCYLFGLSHIDPVERDLFLGRFLNEALETVPDIDLDFPRDIREELILEVQRRYGKDHAGLVCTFPTYRTRSAIREIGKSLDLPAGDLEKLSKLAGFGSAGEIEEEMNALPELRKKARTPLWSALLELAREIGKLPRHISQHPGGMIVSSRPLREIVPLEPAAWEGRVLCQWDKDSCNDAGFIKIDFLSLGMLSLVEEAVDLIAERGVAGRGGEPVAGGAPDLSRIDFQEEKVYDLICSGDTVGLFQVESRAQIQMLRRVRPRTLPDLAVQVAIVRPGPIVGGAVNPYVRHRERLLDDPEYEVPFPHPLLREALGETLGVIIFQDQVLKVCRALAGFSDGQAEGLRRAMSRKRSAEAMEAYRRDFLRGAAKRGVEGETARKVFAQVSAFSQFGFPKSHAAAFALLAYQSAWLRLHYPVEYYVALFNNQPMGFYSLDAIGRDARRHGVRILLPEINRSGVQCAAEGEDLRIGLGFVRGWGEDIAERVVAERERNGSYRSLPDFLRRTPAALRRPPVENLIWVGGFRGMGLTRRELLWQAGLWLGPENDPARSGGRDDHPQFEMALEDPYANVAFPDLDDMERVVAEYRMLHLSASLHPLALLRDELPAGTVSSARFPGLAQGAMVTVAGIVVVRQRPQTAKGYVFVLMEDEHGPINVVIKPPLFERSGTVVRMEPFLAVRGRLQKDGATMNVVATEVRALRPRGGAGARGGGGAGHGGRAGADPSVGGAERETAGEPPSRDPFRYLAALRRAPPGIKSFG